MVAGPGGSSMGILVVVAALSLPVQPCYSPMPCRNLGGTCRRDTNGHVQTTSAPWGGGGLPNGAGPVWVLQSLASNGLE